MHTSPRYRAIVWSCIVFAALVSAAGSLWNLYEQIWWFDEVLHGFTAFTLTLVVTLFLYGSVLNNERAHPILFVLTAASLGIAIGALWEIVEWVYDQVVTGNAILGKTDTIIDLTVDSVGAVLAAVVSIGMVQAKQ